MNLIKLNDFWFIEGDYLDYTEKDKILKVFLISLLDSYTRVGFSPIFKTIEEEKNKLRNFTNKDNKIDSKSIGKLSLLIENYIRSIENYEKQIIKQFNFYNSKLRYCKLFSSKDNPTILKHSECLLIHNISTQEVREFKIKVNKGNVKIQDNFKKYLFNEIIYLDEFPTGYKKFTDCYYGESNSYLFLDSPIWIENFVRFLKEQEKEIS
jgi:hypothetical protein